MANPQKDTVYIDVDDEITSIIEKLKNSPHRIVALVLPKRASVLQSVVNMKLLKRASEQSKKHVVLITSEAGLLPLAGAVGMYVAPTLQSRPSIPPAPDGSSSEIVDESEDFDPDAAATEPVGKLAGISGTAATPAAATGAGAGASAASMRAATAYDEPETIQLDNADSPDTGAMAGGAALGAAAAKAKKPRDKKLKVPNFNKFRLLAIAGVALLLLLVGGFVYANTALSKAVVSLKTNSTDIDTKAELTLDPTATQYDPASNTLPAKIVTKQQSTNQQVASSGQKNNGQKATGEIRIVNCKGGEDYSIPAGTGVSSNGNTYITQESATMELESATCKDTALTADTVKVVAMSPGEKYNIAPTTFSVAQVPEGTVKASSSAAFTGGTDNIVKVVTQADIASATQKLSTQSKESSGVKDELTNKLASAGYTAITGSLHTDEPKVSSSAAVGDQADTVTVTTTTTSSMYGAKEADLKSVVVTNVKKQINTAKQQILKDGVAAAKYAVASTTASGPLQVTMSATSLAGPDIKTDKLIAQLAGKKTGEVQQIVQQIPGVSDATVSYSPFWVSKVPKNTSHVVLVIEKSAASGSSKSANE